MLDQRSQRQYHEVDIISEEHEKCLHCLYTHIVQVLVPTDFSVVLCKVIAYRDQVPLRRSLAFVTKLAVGIIGAID